LLHIERFKKITASEVRKAEGADNDDEVVFETQGVDSVTPEQFAMYEAIEKVARERLPYPVAVEFRLHRGGCRGDHPYSVERLGILVTVTDREMTLSREYACA
jgi:hypothetical protein